MFNNRRPFRAASIVAVSAFVLLTTSGCSLVDTYRSLLGNGLCVIGCS
jgi:hypothetical protein